MANYHGILAGYMEAVLNRELDPARVTVQMLERPDNLNKIILFRIIGPTGLTLDINEDLFYSFNSTESLANCLRSVKPKLAMAKYLVMPPDETIPR